MFQPINSLIYINCEYNKFPIFPTFLYLNHFILNSIINSKTKEGFKLYVTKCNLPNTINEKNGECVCSEGFISDDSFFINGCFKCNDKCHINAKCIYPGKCLCENGLIGDGINNCNEPIPIISSFNLINNSYILIKFKTLTNYSTLNGYCKFNKDIVIGKILEDGILECLIPNNENNFAINFQISFDSINWSLNYTIFFKNILTKYFLIIIFILISFFIYFKIKSKNKYPHERLVENNNIKFSRSIIYEDEKFKN